MQGKGDCVLRGGAAVCKCADEGALHKGSYGDKCQHKCPCYEPGSRSWRGLDAEPRPVRQATEAHADIAF